MKNKVAMFLLMLGHLGAFAQHDHSTSSDEKKSEQTMAMFKDPKLAKAYEQYLTLKNALVDSKFEKARQAASDLEKKLIELNGPATTIELAAKLANEPTLKEQRKTFSNLSAEMATLVKGGRLSSGVLYLEYCPMANSNEGAFWLSNEKEIRNPYFGDKMLKCGMVKEIIQ